MFKISLITGWSDRPCKRLIRFGYQVRCIRYLDVPRTDDALNLEVIQEIEQEQPDLIIVDESSFFAAIPQLKNNPKTQNIPILILLANPYAKLLKNLVFDDYCEKYINPVKLINKIEILLKQKPTSELILELIQANPQGLTLKEIEHQIDRKILKRTLKSLVDEGRVRSKEQEEQLIYYPVQDN